MIENLIPTKAMEGNAYESTRYQLAAPTSWTPSRVFAASSDLKEALGEEFRGLLQRRQSFRSMMPTSRSSARGSDSTCS